MVSESNPTPDEQPADNALPEDAGQPVADAGGPNSAGPNSGTEASTGEVRTLLMRQLEDANQRALRSQAELENFRKRARRELEEERRYATLPLVRDILAVLDNLQLAIQAAEQHEEGAGLLEGVKMVSRQLTEVLKQHHCQEIEAEGAEFDPHMHEAVLHQPSDEHPPGTVTRVTRSGYRLHDRVIRPSQVFVSSGSPTTDN